MQRAGAAVIALPDDLAVAHDDAADARIGMREPAAAFGEVEGQIHVLLVLQQKSPGRAAQGGRERASRGLLPSGL